MNFKPSRIVIIVLLLICSILAFNAIHILPLNIFPVQQKPETPSQSIYDYYIIVDEVDGHSLMYVPLVVNVGDEVLTEGNQRYKVVRIEQNRAFARFVENINL